MAGRGPGIRLLMNMLLLLVTVVELSDSQTHNSVFPEVDPSRQQFFERESLTISCEGLNGQTGWRVMKKRKGDIQTCASTWETSTGPCKIINAYQATDSGKYWCEMGGKEKSNSVNITITDAPVILETPVAPVKEGDNVTLYCRKSDKDSSFTAQFYKNGVSIGSGSAGNTMTLTVSKSFEGFYKCSISEEEESPESWLAVQRHPLQLYLMLCTGFIVLLVVVLLLLVGLCRHHKHQQTPRGHKEQTPNSQISTTFVEIPSSAQTVSAGASKAESTEATYDVISKPSKVKVSAQASMAESTESTYALITNPRKVKESAVPSCSGAAAAGTKASIREKDLGTLYCSVDKQK
ncbi:low affinity immunoglobulin gamma Fc region receptor II-b-like [Archocentrus centrarchus]|uniref:low affinity immunoglobulin gamma Fc region receptor II-b-like n=1 Tax=Archocentrus centrarchus TaxID=63155 RepID=UPI0011EA1AF9|nr:low affinity immunoglobulin gamma Fc region receptor II-b-like [Archocentrus centrarchus]